MKLNATLISEQGRSERGGDSHLTVVVKTETDYIGSLRFWIQPDKTIALTIDGLGIGGDEYVFTPKGDWIEDERPCSDNPATERPTDRCSNCGKSVICSPL